MEKKMSDKPIGSIAEEGNSDDSSESENAKIDSASRARNKTVMLTSDVTGQLRSLLNQTEGAEEATPDANAPDPISSLITNPSVQTDQSWESPKGSSGGVSMASAITGAGNDSPADRRQPTRVMTRDTLPQMPQAPVQPITPAPQMPQAPVQPQQSQQAPQRVASPQSSAQITVNKPVKGNSRRSRIVGFLVSFDNSNNGEIFEVSAGRWLLTSRPTGQEDFILVQDPSISALHAIIRATEDGKIQVLDQLSEHGTGITVQGTKEEKDVSGSMVTVGHGDKVRFGKRNFTVCIIPSDKAEPEKKKRERKKTSNLKKQDQEK